MHAVSSVNSIFSDNVAKAIREELEEHLDWDKLYPLSWFYALARSMHLQDDGLYNSLKNIVSALLDDERRFNIVIYDHEGAAGILFSLCHIADREGNSNRIFSKVLKTVERLRWHDYNGEIMILSYILANKIQAEEYINTLNRDINSNLDKWTSILDYESQRNIAYTLFGLAYIEDKKLIDLINKFKLYSTDSILLKRIMNTHDIELIALILYVFGRIAYNRKMRSSTKGKIRRKKRGIVKIIRDEIIPLLGNILTKRISEAGILPENGGSLPPDLLAKIQLARIESGLDKPFVLSKFEWEIYQEISKALRRGYYRVRKSDLIICLVLNSVVPLLLAIATLTPLLPSPIAAVVTIATSILSDPFKLLFLVALNTLLGINISLLRHGSIKKKYLFGILKLFGDIPLHIKRERVRKN